jgi:hypothetical protein
MVFSEFGFWLVRQITEDPLDQFFGARIQIGKNPTHPALFRVYPFDLTAQVQVVEVTYAKPGQREVQPEAVAGLVFDRAHDLDLETSMAQVKQDAALTKYRQPADAAGLDDRVGEKPVWSLHENFLSPRLKIRRERFIISMKL